MGIADDCTAATSVRQRVGQQLGAEVVACVCAEVGAMLLKQIKIPHGSERR